MEMQKIDLSNLFLVDTKCCKENVKNQGLFAEIFSNQFSEDKGKLEVNEKDILNSKDFEDFMQMLESIASMMGIPLNNMLEKLENGTLDIEKSDINASNNQLMQRLGEIIINQMPVDKKVVDISGKFILPKEMQPASNEGSEIPIIQGSEIQNDEISNNSERLIQLFNEYKKDKEVVKKFELSSVQIISMKWDNKERPTPVVEQQNPMQANVTNPINYADKIVKFAKVDLLNKFEGIKGKKDLTENTFINVFQAQADFKNINNIKEITNLTPTTLSDNINNIIDGIKLIVTEGKKEMLVALTPENLGKVLLKVTSEGGELTARLSVESVQAKEMLSQQLVLLKDSLKEQGFNLKDVEVVYGDQMSGDARFSQHFGGNSNQHQHRQQKYFNGSTSIDNIEVQNIKKSKEVLSTGRMDYLA